MVGWLNVWKLATGCDPTPRAHRGPGAFPQVGFPSGFGPLRAKRWGANEGSPPNRCPRTRITRSRIPPLQTPPAPGHASASDDLRPQRLQQHVPERAAVGLDGRMVGPVELAPRGAGRDRRADVGVERR